MASPCPMEHHGKPATPTLSQTGKYVDELFAQVRGHQPDLRRWSFSKRGRAGLGVVTRPASGRVGTAQMLNQGRSAIPRRRRRSGGRSRAPSGCSSEGQA